MKSVEHHDLTWLPRFLGNSMVCMSGWEVVVVAGGGVVDDTVVVVVF